MKSKNLPGWITAALLAAGFTQSLPAADAPAASGARKPRVEARQELKNLTPEERAAKLNELREKRRETRQALTPEQRQAFVKERRAKVEQTFADLQKKKDGGTLSDEEKKKLERMEIAKKRLTEPADGGSRRGAPGRKKLRDKKEN